MDGYSPYAAYKQRHKEPFKFKMPTFGKGWKKWLSILVGLLAALSILLYLGLGDLRFFMAHYLRLSFFSKNYLILLQNNYELRPGGGFITAYGNFDTLLGFPTHLSFNNSYDIDTSSYVKPPYPHEELLKNEWYQGYTFRDANWDPNFPEATKAIIDFYRQKFPKKDVDGIIVVNFSLIENLVDAFGGVTVDGKELTRHNLFSEMEFAVNNVDRHSEEALGNRKNILSDLAGALTQKMKWNPIKTKRVLSDGLKNKDLYIWLKSEGLERRLQKRGWANHFELPPDSDFLAVNLANLGAKKADRYMVREVHHHVNITKELPEVSTEVTIRFPGSNNIYSDDYKGYLRVYIPAVATIKDSPLDSVVDRDGDFNVISAKVIIPAGSKTTLSYTYTLPRTLLPTDEYRLRLIRQSGNAARYTITAETMRDTSMESGNFKTYENRAIFEEVLTNDRDLSLSLLPDTTPPYPIEQVFEDLNTIKIYWSEPIDATTGGDALNYVIGDTNQKNEELDEAKVVYAEVIDGSVSKLELEGVKKQDLERYKIELKNLKDTAGNAIFPNPKTITVVQRYQTVVETTEE
ncbi:MAG: DUF4012 domain-containing protein [Candidatus Peregrinibacteria bacterium]